MSKPIETTAKPDKEAPTPDTILDVQQTTCCIVGGGPSGAVLAIILARQGIPTILLEARKTSERDLRGDIIHAGAMEIMDELGISDRLLADLPHSKIEKLEYITSEESVTFADFSRLKTKHPYMTIFSHIKLLEFISSEVKRSPNCQLIAGASVQQLIEENGIIRGVRYRGQGGWHEVRSHLTVGADGRFSQVRKLAGMELLGTALPIDLFWLRLPRIPEEPPSMKLRLRNKRALVIYNTYDGNWQIGSLIPKGQSRQIQAAGIEAFRQSIVDVVPEFCDRLNEHLKDWKQVSFLSIQLGRIERWYRLGLLLIGDAAHVMSPMGGVGINYAIQDAVAAANVLIEPLLRGEVRLFHLARVQQIRELPIKIIQAFQSFTQTNVTIKALQSDKLRLPMYLRLPVLRNIPAQLLAFGVFPPRLKAKYRVQNANYDAALLSSEKAFIK